MASPDIGASEWIRVRASGKVNLALRVGGARPDGYHSLGTVFQAVSIYDELAARWVDPGTFSVTVSGDQAALVPANDRNIAVKAARLLAASFGTPDLGVELTIRKQIPVTGGMAGGSADAAAALLACSVLWDLDTTPDDLLRLGAQLGADVPFSLMGGNALGTGRGDHLVPALCRGTFHWVLAFSDGELSTPAVFRAFDEMHPNRSPEPLLPTEVMNALASGDPAALGRVLVNDLEPASLRLRPQLAAVLETGRDLGALGAIISGSGPTCAFLAANETAAVDLSVRLSSEGICRAVRRVTGPVPGARLISS